ncbi:DLA class I histocompatibility antigen, A9/A9 alpha chain-like [Garra rufa]|uniref:DLA class I histocompatibility antigen, A9/A9 alpha chain-like n=1 Tax=Garra rufa TaxID=137080 RepID=UPI003CCEA7CD
MLILVYLFSLWTVINAGSHSLMVLATYIDGHTPFPEFSVVLMLDDLQIAYYDSVTWKTVYRSHSDSKYYDEEQSDADSVFRYMYDGMKFRTFHLKDQNNCTDGVHVHQIIAGCELLNNGNASLFHFWDGFSGQNIDKFTFDMKKDKIQEKRPWTVIASQIKWGHLMLMYETVHHPICIKVLRRYLLMKKNNVMRKVKPRVRLIRKTLSESRELQISCLATGFYPRHINLTLFRNGQPVDDGQITGGDLLPNGDGTYQMRKSLMISEEEQHEGHVYNCSMKHLNLDNKLDIMFDVAESDPGSFSLSVVFSLLVFMLVAVLIITALIIWKKRCAAGQGSETSVSDYSLTPSSLQDET